MKLSDVINDCMHLELNGVSTDSAIQCFGGNLLEENKPILAVEVSDKEILLWMMQEADHAHIFISGDVIRLNAMYEANERFPAARIYYIQTEDLLVLAQLGVFIEKHGIKLRPVNDLGLAKLVDNTGYAQRYEQWLKRWKADANHFDGLLEGRLKNTAVEQGIWLSSDGRCLICGEKTDRMATSTVWGKSGLMIGMQLCETHETESQNQLTLLNYISKQLSGAVMFSNMRPRTREESLQQTCETLSSDLDCTIVKVEGDTVTARRKSGITIVARQVSPSNYAYNVLSPEGRQLSRIDSADHHKVPYGPDHVHSDLRKSKKKIVHSSYTYGDVALDNKLLLELVEEAERKL